MLGDGGHKSNGSMGMINADLWCSRGVGQVRGVA